MNTAFIHSRRRPTHTDLGVSTEWTDTHGQRRGGQRDHDQKCRDWIAYQPDSAILRSRGQQHPALGGPGWSKEVHPRLGSKLQGAISKITRCVQSLLHSKQFVHRDYHYRPCFWPHVRPVHGQDLWEQRPSGYSQPCLVVQLTTQRDDDCPSERPCPRDGVSPVYRSRCGRHQFVPF